MIKVDWGDHEETIIVWHFDDAWSAEDYAIAWWQSNQFAMSKPHKVNILTDLRRTGKIAPNLLPTLLSYLPDQSPNIGLSVMITHPENRSWAWLYGVLENFYKRPETVRFVEQVDEAYALVEETPAQVIKPKGN